jgi:tetraacyldisaccharide 4'-kinase
VLQRLKILLYPLALLYALVVRLRNHLYNIGYKKEISFDVLTIGVGNLVMGGTGKTPFTEYLIRELRGQFKIAVLSRGYGRTSQGTKIISKNDTVKSVGDEPLQVFNKFGEDVVVAVGENRLLAIREILQQHPEVNLILLDDIYQHRKVKPTFNLLLTNYSSPFYFDWIFPAGWLRESRRGARRADAIIVNKCPVELEPTEIEKVTRSIRRYSNAPVFFSTLKYGNPVSFGLEGPVSDSIILVSAIANNYLFRNYGTSKFKVIKHFTFEDHHYYSEENIAPIIELAKSRNASIITTEKDMVKLKELGSVILNTPWFYLPVSIEFLDDKESFHGMILEKAKTLQSDGN